MKPRRVLVIGVGRFGDALLETLWREGAETIAIDADPEQVQRVKDRTSATFVGDVTDARVLGALDLGHIDVAVVTFGEDFEASVLCTHSLKTLGVKEVIARAPTERQAQILRAVGASRVVQIEQEMGRRLASELGTEVAADLIDFAHDYRVVPWIANGSLVGKTIVEADLRRRHEINVLGVRAADGSSGTKLALPRPDYVIRTGDTLMLVGTDEAISRFERAD